MQGFIIWECMKMKGLVSNESLDLRKELVNLGSLVDEAIDFIADSASPSPIAAAAGGSIPEIILSGLMSKMMMPSEHGSKTQQEERQVLQDNKTQNETETQLG